MYSFERKICAHQEIDKLGYVNKSNHPHSTLSFFNRATAKLIHDYEQIDTVNNSGKVYM